MALPLWEECSWVKSITSLHHKQFLHEKEKREKVLKEKNLAETIKAKEELDAENRRKQLEQNEKLKRLTNALFSAPEPPAKVKAEETSPIPAEGEEEGKRRTSVTKSSLFDDDAVPSEKSTNDSPAGDQQSIRRSSVKKSLFDEDEPPRDDRGTSARKKGSLFGEEDEEPVKTKEEPKQAHQKQTEGEKTSFEFHEVSEMDDKPESKSPTDSLSPSEAPAVPVASTNADVSPPSASGPAEETQPVYPFPVSHEINAKIFLHLGAGYKIPCNAIIVGQNENLSDRNEDNASLITLAGPSIEEELAGLAPIQTGESVITTGGALPCDWVIHAVGPRYDEKYLTASEHALFSAYKSSLVLAMEKDVKDLVITCIYSKKKKYPRFEAAHVALRTIRKFLQHSSIQNAFHRIMFCVPGQDDYEIYSALLSAYFPRSEDELIDSLNLLPKELGDEWGQILLEDRILKVSAGPKPLALEDLQQYKRRNSATKRDENNDQGDSGNDYEEFGASHSSRKKTGENAIVPVGERPKSMSEITHDDDEIRRAKVAKELSKLSREERLKLRYQAMVPDIETEPLDDIAALHFFDVVGKDAKGNSVVLITAANLGKVCC